MYQVKRAALICDDTLWPSFWCSLPMSKLGGGEKSMKGMGVCSNSRGHNIFNRSGIQFGQCLGNNFCSQDTALTVKVNPDQLFCLVGVAKGAKKQI